MDELPVGVGIGEVGQGSGALARMSISSSSASASVLLRPKKKQIEFITKSQIQMENSILHVEQKKSVKAVRVCRYLPKLQHFLACTTVQAFQFSDAEKIQETSIIYALLL